MENSQLGTAHGATILVVEDDPDTREFYELLLATADYHALSAGTGRSALALADGQFVEAVLLDRRLPDMDGIAVCGHLRAQLGPDVPIMLVTADRDNSLDGAARGAGATDILLKPFDPADLLRLLARLMNGHEVPSKRD